jgi:hypothetical protein
VHLLDDLEVVVVTTDRLRQRQVVAVGHGIKNFCFRRRVVGRPFEIDLDPWLSGVRAAIAVLPLLA